MYCYTHMCYNLEPVEGDGDVWFECVDWCWFNTIKNTETSTIIIKCLLYYMHIRQGTPRTDQIHKTLLINSLGSRNNLEMESATGARRLNQCWIKLSCVGGRLSVLGSTMKSPVPPFISSLPRFFCEAECCDMSVLTPSGSVCTGYSISEWQAKASSRVPEEPRRLRPAVASLHSPAVTFTQRSSPTAFWISAKTAMLFGGRLAGVTFHRPKSDLRFINPQSLLIKSAFNK